MEVVVENKERTTEKAPDYNALDKPAAIRKRENLAQAGKRVVGTDLADDFLDIPAFLRRQAD
jgi:hypothetical protein